MSDHARAAFSPRSFECRVCHKCYNKSEHLTRHERSHSGSKPFLCPHCHRQFSRQDSLARHAKLHGRSNRLFSSYVQSGGRSQLSPNDAAFDSTTRVLNQVPMERGNTQFEALSVSAKAECLVFPSDTDIEVQLTWPDSEELLQKIMSADLDSWQLPLEVLPYADIPGFVPSYEAQAMTPIQEESPAIRNLSQMITAQSASVTAEVESTGITSLFLDSCLHMFFEKFIPSLPVLHRGTFVYRECIHPLLLNAIALGSLFLGPKDAIAKGEALWRLAHTAVATSWQTMINHRGSYDACNGIQLVQTAVLGQVYAILSKNLSLRMTGQIFHGLGFYWARHCGMYDVADLNLQNLPDLESPSTDKDRKWKMWASRELQLRALLAHYVLDGQISEFSGHPTCARHVANPLSLPCPETVFSADTYDEWITQMNKTRHKLYPSSFLKVFCAIFEAKADRTTISPESTVFSLRVVLEGLKSLVTENHLAGACAFGSPSKRQLFFALGQIYNHINLGPALSLIHRSEAMLRWHAISLDAAVNSTWLCSTICHQFGVEQKILGGAFNPRHTVNIQEWIYSPEARLALLHAMAIHELTTELPLGHAHAIHIPASLFVAATVYCSFLLAGSSTIAVPKVIDWSEVMFEDLCFPDGNDMLGPIGIRESNCKLFLRGSFPSPTATTKNLLYDLNLLQIYLRCLSQQWGVCSNMEAVLDQWISLCT